ncbi:uncharacterized protein F4817DRAFT_174175 [Daldinia loculata]|uniref:uncharacterized protein n=1 Tax=Daldinia loculata TaxID=103429 RepID=UPI0020C2FCC5|nr:uncharacterized protein F4817DRAFT_174175 [Daldinia loculata]KAI1645475.1 hypothetical protein F4817DRAFT_174175 [Daldinia loculata]
MRQNFISFSSFFLLRAAGMTQHSPCCSNPFFLQWNIPPWIYSVSHATEKLKLQAGDFTSEVGSNLKPLVASSNRSEDAGHYKNKKTRLLAYLTQLTREASW